MLGTYLSTYLSTSTEGPGDEVTPDRGLYKHTLTNARSCPYQCPPSSPMPLSRVQSHRRRRGPSQSHGIEKRREPISALASSWAARAAAAPCAPEQPCRRAPREPPAGGAPGRCRADGGRAPGSVAGPVAAHAAVCESRGGSGFLGWRAGETWAAMPCAEQRHGLQPEGCRGGKHSRWLQLPRASSRLQPATYRL